MVWSMVNRRSITERLQTNDSSPGANDGDRPVKFNQRMGFKAGTFQYAQNIPLDQPGITFPAGNGKF